MQHAAFPEGVTRDRLIDWYRDTRRITRELFTIPAAAAYYERPIRLRNPIVFYEGHIPAFAVNTVIKQALMQDGIDAEFERLFARGIDPENEDAAPASADLWPARDDVQAYGRDADDLIFRALCDGPIDDGAVPERRNAEAAFTVIEHEQMHQETLLYLFHELPYDRKHPIAPLRRSTLSRGDVVKDMVRIPAGEATLGGSGSDFGWDNEFPRMRIDIGEFSIDRHDVTNGDYLEYLEATNANPPHFWTKDDGAWQWRGLFELKPLPLEAPVYVTHDEASAYAAWRGKRLPTEGEYHRAAFGAPSGEERLFPWGSTQPNSSHGNFGFTHWDPIAIGSFPAGVSAWGVHDLVGNGWEWTSTAFDAFPGFEAMSSYPQYSADFFDGKHYVMKGASPATPPELIRRSFRNWFRPSYPYAYATFRCAHD